jgi:hypothetical protein
MPNLSAALTLEAYERAADFAVLAWSVGTVVGILFVLNAIALAMQI